MIMTSSPLLHSLPGTPPNASPSLRPKQMPVPSASGSGSGSSTPLTSLTQQVSTLSCSAPINSNLTVTATAASTSTSTTTINSTNPTTIASPQRSYARAPPIRPYASPMLSRGSKGIKEVQGDTKQFGEMVVQLVEERSRRSRKGRTPTASAVITAANSPKDDTHIVGGGLRASKSLGTSLAGSWEQDRVELIVDIPVWTPGCFQDLSTLHALRDTTLFHTHSLLTFLQKDHSLPSSYRLLARSTTGNNAHVGWGCIRLAPSLHSPLSPKKDLKPAVRRSSFVYDQPGSPSTSPNSRRRSSGRKNSSSTSTSTSPTLPNAISVAMPRPTRIQEAFESDSAVLDDDDEEEDEHARDRAGKGVKLLDGYLSGTTSDEDEEESADEIVAREVEKRGAKEGQAFLMTLFGQPALILT